MLDPSWGQVGAMWVGPKLGLCWPMLRTCGVETVHLDDAGPINCHASAPSVRADLAYTCILYIVYPKIAITHRRLGVVYFQPNPSSEINEILELRLSLRKVFGGWHLHLGSMYSMFSFE
jgi:hypothetical protein